MNHIINLKTTTKPKILIRIFFYSIWMILGLVQANYTELINDEAYYWKFSTILDWGYFDHPPLTALLIRFGYSLFQNEFGVRLLFVVFSTMSIYLIEIIVKPKNQLFFYFLISSIAFLHIGGVLAVPDVPLLFFSTLFFVLFRQYLDFDRVSISILLGICIVALFYTKYHALLIVGIPFLLNFQLMKRQSFWLIIFMATLLFIPHVLWQINNDFPSLKYHIVDRNNESYLFKDTLNYLITIPLVFGPFVGFFLLFSLFYQRVKNDFEKTLKLFCIIYLCFFLLMTFKGPIEGNWLFVLLLPLIYFGNRMAEKNILFHKTIVYLFPITILLIIGARIFCVYDFTMNKWNTNIELHNNEVWSNEINKVAGDLPVAFMNSYKYAAKYEFYTGNKAFSLTNAMGRKDQFNLWDTEYYYQGKRVLLILNYPDEKCPVVYTFKGDFYYYKIENFRSFGNIRIKTHKHQYDVSLGDSIEIDFQLEYFNKQKRDFESNSEFPVHMSYTYFLGGVKFQEEISRFRLTNRTLLNSKQKHYKVKIPVPLHKGKYTLKLGFKSGWLPATFNGRLIRIEVKK